MTCFYFLKLLQESDPEYDKSLFEAELSALCVVAGHPFRCALVQMEAASFALGDWRLQRKGGKYVIIELDNSTVNLPQYLSLIREHRDVLSDFGRNKLSTAGSDYLKFLVQCNLPAALTNDLSLHQLRAIMFFGSLVNGEVESIIQKYDIRSLKLKNRLRDNAVRHLAMSRDERIGWLSHMFLKDIVSALSAMKAVNADNFHLLPQALTALDCPCWVWRADWFADIARRAVSDKNLYGTFAKSLRSQPVAHQKVVRKERIVTEMERPYFLEAIVASSDFRKALGRLRRMKRGRSAFIDEGVLPDQSRLYIGPMISKLEPLFDDNFKRKWMLHKAVSPRDFVIAQLLVSKNRLRWDEFDREFLNRLERAKRYLYPKGGEKTT